MPCSGSALHARRKARSPQAIDRLQQMPSTVIAVDLPSGLNADTGQKLGALAVRATHTLSLLTLKPGLFTADGRDHAGQIWLDDLGVAASALPPSARLAGAERSARGSGAAAPCQPQGQFR